MPDLTNRAIDKGDMKGRTTIKPDPRLRLGRDQPVEKEQDLETG